MTELRRVYQGLGHGIVMLLRLLARLIVLLFWLLALLLRWIRDGRPPRKPQACPDEVPNHVRRRPDPCIYSQSYLAKHGLPVTWNNPDIILTDASGTPVGSDDLLPGTTYQVIASISNASFDAAIGVSVSCRFRGWGVSVEEGVPVELNGDGTEVVRIIDIAPWGAEPARYSWTTPDTPGHFCLRVECQHLDDLNTANNAGQENTTVRPVESGQALTVPLLISNPDRTPSSIRFTIDTYAIDDQRWDFDLISSRIPLGAPRRPGRAERRERRQPGLSRFENWAFRSHRDYPTYTHYRYVGRQAQFESERRKRPQLPPGWTISLDGTDVTSPVLLGPHENRQVDVTIMTPPGVPLNPDRVPINLTAWSVSRGLVGGVTIVLEPDSQGGVA